MGNGAVLRVFRFRPVGYGADVDARLRDGLLPGLVELPGLRETYVGRRGPDDAGERLVVSIWDSRAAMDAAARSEPAAGSDARRLEIETASEVGPSAVEVAPLAVDLGFDRAEPPQVLRVFRGTCRPGELEAYVEEARNGTLADAMTPHGPLGLHLGPIPPDRFITVSIWSDWSSIEAATRGNLRQPIATSSAARLSGGTATHYEVVPSTAYRPARRAPVG